MGPNFFFFIMRIATRQGEYGHKLCTLLEIYLAHTVGQSSTFELQIYYCGVMLLTADNLLYLGKVIYPNLKT